MLKCNVCGHELSPNNSEGHYVARDNSAMGLAAFSASSETALYDAFDCPVCGCQIIAGPRKRDIPVKCSCKE